MSGLSPSFLPCDKKSRNVLSNLSSDDKESSDIDYEKMIREMADEDENTYVDMIEIVRGVITHGGLSNIVETIIDLYAGVVFYWLAD